MNKEIMNNQKLKCRIIMKTDIKGFSNRIGLLSDLELSTLLTEHKLFIKNKVEENNGIIIKGEGDAFWIVFDSATKAVQSAISIQNELREEGVGKKENARLSIRISITLGDIIEKDKDIFGEAVNLCSRIESITPSDGIYLSNSTFLALRKKNIQTSYIGEYDFKGFSNKEKVYKVFLKHNTIVFNDCYIWFSDIEKFSYLKGHLGGEAEQCIGGIALTNGNYKEAVSLLKERFGNPQLMIQSHMRKLVKLEKIKSGRQVKELRSLYDQLESHVRSLQTVGVELAHYGPMLTPFVLERLPDEIKLEISRKLGKEEWKITEFLAALKKEITARENCFLMKSSSGEDAGDSEPRRITTGALLADTKILACAFCKRNHFHDRCTVLTDVNQRKDIVRKNRLCYKCLFQGHAIRNCRSKRNCFKCKSSSHHTAICMKDEQKKEMDGDTEKTSQNVVSSSTSVLLQTARGMVSDNAEKRRVPIKILLDAGSQRTYLSERVVKQLKLHPKGSKSVVVNTFGNEKGKSDVYNEYEFCVKNDKRGCHLYMTGFAVPFICSPLMDQKVELVENVFPMLQSLDLSDIGEKSGEIDLLIGADYYWSVVDGETKRCGNDGLVAVNSRLGWVLSGPYQWKNPDAEAVNLITHVLNVQCYEEEKLLSAQVEKFYHLDTIGIAENEMSVYERFLTDVKFEDRRYKVQLPFKEDFPMVEDHYVACLALLQKLKCRLDKNPKMLERYDEVMQNQLKLGIIEEVRTKPEVGAVMYQPHHEVVKEEKSTTKFRVVYNCSFKRRKGKNKGRSLNDCLYKGPSLNPLLYDILLRFRVFDIVLSADAEAAYLQIVVDEAHRDYLRIIWYDDVKKKNPEIKKFRFTRVIFGATSSQFLLNGVFRQHAGKYEEEDPEFTRFIEQNLFVDDLNGGVPTFEKGVEMYEKIKWRFSEASFNFRKWRTNNPELQAFIDSQENVDAMTREETLVGGKVLGITWNEITDELIIDVRAFVKDADKFEPTKRSILRITAGMYDPVGAIQPLVIKWKLLFQEVWKSGIGWDDKVDEKLTQKYSRIVKEFREAENVVIPRCYCKNDVTDPVTRIEMHGFSDASEVAYAACVYLKFIKASGNVTVTFVTSKSRIAPTKGKHTIPRLELLGNLILSRLMVSVSEALNDEVIINEKYYWTDSMVALVWIKSKEKEFKDVCTK